MIPTNLKVRHCDNTVFVESKLFHDGRNKCNTFVHATPECKTCDYVFYDNYNRNEVCVRNTPNYEIRILTDEMRKDYPARIKTLLGW